MGSANLTIGKFFRGCKMKRCASGTTDAIWCVPTQEGKISPLKYVGVLQLMS